MTEPSQSRGRPALHRLLQTLVLVDVQYWFLGESEADQKLLRKILLQVRLAKKLCWPIVVVELVPAGMLPHAIVGAGKTRDEIMEELRGYEHFEVVQKRGTDGSAEVLDACAKRQFHTDRFRVIGLTTHACVTATATGLAKRVPPSTVEVIRRACAPHVDGCWTELEQASHIELRPSTESKAA
jgi:nicotinamidase-related amidase